MTHNLNILKLLKKFFIIIFFLFNIVYYLHDYFLFKNFIIINIYLFINKYIE